MLGVDSRAAMQPAGFSQGIGNLGDALLMAPLHYRQQKLEEEKLARENERDAFARSDAMAQRDYQNRALAQSLGLKQADMQTERDVAATRAGAMRDDAMIRAGDASAAAPAMDAQGYSNSPIATDRDPGPSADLSQALGVGKYRGSAPSARPVITPPAKPAPGAKPPSMQWQHNAQTGEYYRTRPDGTLETSTGKPPAAGAPSSMAAPPASAPGRLSNAAASALPDMQSDFDAESAAAQAKATAPASPSGKAVRTSIMRQMVQQGQFPDMLAAIQSAKANGHDIINDDAGSPQTVDSRAR